jgi:hypothetical protein
MRERAETNETACEDRQQEDRQACRSDKHNPFMYFFQLPNTLIKVKKGENA